MARQNGISIEDMMKMECMKSCKIIAGFKGIRNTISKINIMADPDILNWVDEGELLLTTAYSFKKDNVKEQKSLIRECSKKKLAGIGIKISPYLESLSQEVLDLANDLDFPIIDLYYATPFSDIMTPVFKEIFNKQAYLLQKMEHVHEQLMNAVLSGGDIYHIAGVISDNLKNPIIIKLALPDKMVGRFEDVPEDIKELLIENANTFYDFNNEPSKEKKLDESKELIHGKYIKRMVVPIVVNNTVYGYIFAWAVNTPLGGFDLSVLETASTTMALEILRKLSIKEVENRYKAEFLEDLLSLEEKRKYKAIERASFYNLSNNDRYVAIVVNIKSKELEGNGKLISSDSMRQEISKLTDLNEKLIRDFELTGICASKTESILVLLSFKKDMKINKILDEFIERMETLVQGKTENIEFRIGVGRPYEGLESVYNSYIDSLRAIRAGRILNRNPIVSFEELGIFKILCQDHLTEELEKFYDSTLKPLVEYDNKKSTELVKTLEAYFKNNGNLKKMSDVLYTHYNTVLYRVQRINEITGMDLENSDDRLNLDIALKIKQLLKK